MIRIGRCWNGNAVSPLMHQPALRYFLEVARTGSISAAAERLRVAASAISRQVAKLEEEYETPLFERRSRGMVLTHAGRLLASYAQRASLESDQIQRKSVSSECHARSYPSWRDRGARGQFRSGNDLSFRKERPHIVFDIKVVGPANVVTGVQEGQVDVGITFSLSPEGGCAFSGSGLCLPLRWQASNHPLIGRGRVPLRSCSSIPSRLWTMRQPSDECSTFTAPPRASLSNPSSARLT